MTREELDKDMIESIEMWLHEIEPKWVEKELAWLEELRTRLLEEETPNDLEEAASEYKERVIEETKCHHNALTYAEGYEDALLLIPDAFIAGAKWQKGQDDKELSEKIAAAYQLGLADKQKQMLSEAVEGVVMDFSSNQPRPQVDVYVDPNKYCTGDKVRVIVCKKED